MGESNSADAAARREGLQNASRAWRGLKEARGKNPPPTVDLKDSQV